MKLPEKPPKISELGVMHILHFMDRKDLVEFISMFNDKYYYWDKLKYLEIPKNIDIKTLWTHIKYIRYSGMSKIDIFKDKKMIFKFNTTSNYIQQKLHELDLLGGGNFMSQSLVPEDDRKKYFISSLMEESIASSQLEGATTSRKIAKEMLRNKRKPRNTAEKMIVNNYVTMEMLLKLTSDTLTSAMLKDIQKRITQDTLEDDGWEGDFRKTNDAKVHDKETGDVVHVPPPHEKVPDLIESLCEFANSKEHNYIHPIIKASILHFLIGYIHPFEDGNGRTARSVFYWYLLKEGYWPLKFMSVSRIILKSTAQYARAYLYSEYDDYDITYFLMYKIDVLEKSLNELRDYVSRKAEEKKKMYDFIKIDKINERQAKILSEFVHDPRKILTITEVQDDFDVVYETARKNLLELESLGFLKKKISGKKMLFFKSEEFDDLAKDIA